MAKDCIFQIGETTIDREQFSSDVLAVAGTAMWGNVLEPGMLMGLDRLLFVIRLTTPKPIPKSEIVSTCLVWIENFTQQTRDTKFMRYCGAFP